MKKFLIIIFAVVFLSGCSQIFNPIDEKVTPTEKVFLKNGDYYELKASQVKVSDNENDLTMLAYNGSIPGPSLYIEQGSEINLKFINNTKFNTSLHSHGIRLANKFDGVPGITQDEIKPGQTFDYKISFPDSGVYFYHPHTREDFQQDAGMYGAFVVLPKNTGDTFEFLNNENHYLVFLDDTDVERWTDKSLNLDKVKKTLMGSYGSRMFIQGDFENPFNLGSHNLNDEIFVTFINSANVRPYNLSIDGVKMTKIAGDASGFQKQEEITNLIIGPSERYTVKFEFNTKGNYELFSKSGTQSYVIANVEVNELSSNKDKVILEKLNIDQNLLNSFYKQKVNKNLELTMTMDDSLMKNMMTGVPCHKMPDGSWMGNCSTSNDSSTIQGIELEDGMPAMNSMSNLDNVKWSIVDTDTNKSNMNINWQFDKGDYVKIKVTNSKSSMHPMQHPFHIHGQRFLVLTQNGQKNSNLAWKDTVQIPAGETYELIVEMSNPGTWLVHCHIPEHMESGMMMKFNVN